MLIIILARIAIFVTFIAICVSFTFDVLWQKKAYKESKGDRVDLQKRVKILEDMHATGTDHRDT